MGQSDVQGAALAICQRLAELGIPYALCGGLAVGRHGHLRFTEDVDLLLSPQGLALFKAHWLGKGWVEHFPGSRSLRDTIHGVKVDILLAGDFPGDGRPGPIAFPDPSEVAEMDEDGLALLNLQTLVELKIAASLTAPHRLKDQADVIALIHANRLDREFAARLAPTVRDVYADLWQRAQGIPDDD